MAFNIMFMSVLTVLPCITERERERERKGYSHRIPARVKDREA
jgi:hypothetical protein